jgi:mannosylglycoprotein endo-beta-mannosidase
MMVQKIFTGGLWFVLLYAFGSCAPVHVSTQSETSGKPVLGYELDSGWVCRNVKDVHAAGEALSIISLPLTDWIPATVPGTVLTTLVNNGRAPDPFYGMNARSIPDIHVAGREMYTYWFVKDFHERAPAGKGQVWLRLRGVNYGCDLFLNGHKLNPRTHYGMFLRQSYNITPFLSDDGKNRLAVIVYPPDPVGNANGGQGGDGTIGRNVSNQYVAGWDWIQPIPDRNTGIWDKVTIERTNTVSLNDPYVITLVPGKRFPDRPQAPAILRVSADVENPTDQPVRGTVQYAFDGVTVRQEVEVRPFATAHVKLPDYMVQHPRLWWPNGYGAQELTTIAVRFASGDGSVMDERSVTTGMREIQTRWNPETRSREVLVNGQKIFMKGGNWIASDAMLRFSPDRYDAEIRFHRDMNLNLIRIWGGATTERPEFYAACDRYGLLVMQDFWMSGDCNGKWLDPMKSEDQWTRRRYPDDHALFLRSVADQVKMIRNHPSLAFYCGGNEIPPPEDILTVMQDSLLPALDSSRYFFTYSNVDSMSFNSIGGNGDGGYRIQPIEHFWEYRSFPFNSEIGSVGLGDIASLERFIPQGNMVVPDEAGRRIDSVWRYHKYGGYGGSIDTYGKPKDVKGFTDRAQLVNYDQYRALMEGHLAHMWEWYTGVIIWKTQNPWSAMRGQMYDPWLDPNGGLYGLHHANVPLHIMCNPADGMLMVVNNTFNPRHDLMVQARTFDHAGKDSLVFQWFVEVGPTTVQKIDTIRRILKRVFAGEGGFLELRLSDVSRHLLDRNLYWFPDSSGVHSGMQRMAAPDVKVSARNTVEGKIDVTIENPPGGPLAFFLRVSLVNEASGKRILPVFYSDNYISVLPDEKRTITIECPPRSRIPGALVSISGWNVPERRIRID